MAKRNQTSGTTDSTQHKIEDFAEDLGNLLGTARAKAEGWLGQRAAIVKNLTDLRDTATRLLSDLGHEAQRTVGRARAAGTGRKPGRPAGSGKKKRTMSADARRRISEAQKKRWAAQKAGDKKK
jgi:hypothetical protein